MVAEPPGLTWKTWALEGADAGRLLGRDRLNTGGYKLQNDEPVVTVAHQPQRQSEMLERKSHEAWERIAVSPSNETKRSTAASSGPQSPRYEGQPHHDGIAVWRDTQSLAESLRADLPAPRIRRSPVTSPLRQRPLSASLLSDRVPASESAMPPWMSTLGLSHASQASHPSPTSSSAFAEAAMGRLAWLQAEKEALEGWLNNAGYLSMGKENEIQHSHRTNHSEFSDAKMAQDAFRHSEAEPVMERHPEIMAVHHTGEHHTGVHHTAVHHTGVHHSAVHTGVHPTMHLSQDRSSDTSGIERSSTGRRSNPSRRTSVLEERNYQALVAERAAAEAKLQKDLRAVAPERWSEPMYQDRQDHHYGMQRHTIQPRNSAPPGGLQEAFADTEPVNAHGEARLTRLSESLAVGRDSAVTQPTFAHGQSSRTSLVESFKDSSSRHSSPSRQHYSIAGRRHTQAGGAERHHTDEPPVPALHVRHSSPPMSSAAQADLARKASMGRSSSPSKDHGHHPGTRSRRSSEVPAELSQSPGDVPGRQKAPSFSWPGASASAEAQDPARKASVGGVSSGIHQPSASGGRARAVTEVGLPAGRSRERYLSVPDVSTTRRQSQTHGSASRHNTPPRNGVLFEAHRSEGFEDVEGSESSSSESPEEAARRQSEVEKGLQELASRLGVRRPHPRPVPKGSSKRSTVSGGPVDLLALAGKTKSEAGRALGAVGAAGEVECRPVWRRTVVDSEVNMATE